MNNFFMFLMFAGTFFTAVSQVLLKRSAQKTYRHPIYEYLNWRVMLAYAIFFGVLLVNTYAFTGVDMKYGTVIDAFSYVFVMILSYVILKEKFSKGRVIGNLIIITGIMIYTL
ncbi:MAG: EamA family transporter [Eubacteriales bacterium]|nr:EamA family transporter [Eubacteriales bacterium]